MKNILKNTLIFGLAATGIASCSENSWNDQLPGFNPDPEYSDVRSLDYTLTASDYARIAGNYRNVALAKSENVSSELKSVGTLGYLNQAIAPDKYIPAFLRDSLFKYYSMTEGSAINITYQIAKNLPEKMVQMNAAQTYTVTDADYQALYGSDEDFASTFCPKYSASKNLPKILATAIQNPTDGSYVVVNYNNSDLDPTFSNTSTFTETNVLGNVTLNAEVDVKGIVTGICARGFILTDKGGSVLVYQASGFVPADWKIGDKVSVKGAIAAYNKGFQIDASKATIVKEGEGKYTYPSPKVFTGEQMDNAILAANNATALYCQFTATASISGSYYNLNVAGATTAQGSVYQITDEFKSKLENGKTYTITGYFTSISTTTVDGKKVPKFFNVLLTDVTPIAAAGAPKRVTRGGSQVPTTAMSAIYQYTDKAWKTVSDIVVLQQDDYKAMGASSDLKGDMPATCIPTYMAKNFPYAQAGDVKYVLYKYYNGKTSVFRTEEYTYENGMWVNSVSNGGVVTETNQFVYKKQGWVMDPSITLTLPAGKSQPTSSWFYQTCVDWVKNNVENGAAFVSSYGNNEYYCGTSAYQGNLDLRASAARVQNPTAYPESMTDDEVVALMKKRFETEVCPGALSVLYPNMMPVDGVDVTVTINFSVYDGSGTKEYQIVQKVVGKGKFEFVSCTWNN